ncbi:MAG: polysaccharide deacetylase family protein [Bacteroidia bacterium]|nr:polysaccharide deacetylase family protein [Bacteroidia bacterium]
MYRKIRISSILCAAFIVCGATLSPVSAQDSSDHNVYYKGGITRGDPSRKSICLVFTAADRADGTKPIIEALKRHGVKGAFFFTGVFFERFPDEVRTLLDEGHYVGSHSYGHLLYAPWENGDSTIVSRKEFTDDMAKSFAKMGEFGITAETSPYWIPPYEHYNDTISKWSAEMGLKLMNYTSGTRTNGDYTTPDMKSYMSSDYIMNSVLEYERTHTDGLNGHFMLIHLGTSPLRTDKFYNRLDELIVKLEDLGYEFVSVKDMIENQ